MFLQQVSEPGGVDTATFLVIASAMGTAITGLAGLLYKRLMDENAELRKRLAAYETNAPELIAVIEQWMSTLEQPSSASPRSEDSPSRSELPAPLSRRRSRRDQT